MVELSSDANIFDPDQMYKALGTERVAAELLRVDERCFEMFALRLMTPSSRLIVFIASHGSISVGEGLRHTSLSYRAFYSMLKRLKDQGMIRISPDQEDRRVKRLSLTQTVRDFSQSLR